MGNKKDSSKRYPSLGHQRWKYVTTEVEKIRLEKEKRGEKLSGTEKSREMKRLWTKAKREIK